MIRKILMSSVAIVAISGTAFAADLPSRRAPPVYIPPVPVFSWTGFYVGGQVGYGFGSDKERFTTADGEEVPAGVFKVGNEGNVIGGGHVGYNYQLGGAGLGGFGLGLGGIVVGIEGDVDGSNDRTTIDEGLITVTHKDQIEGSVRGRVGIAVDRALFYATGGAAFAGFKDTFFAPGAGVSAFDHTRVGYTVGGGVEYAITPQWSLRAEYRYSNFGHYDIPFFGAVNHPVEERAQVGFSYKFDTPIVPVVARY